jgi:hypothetical protein
MKAAIPLATTSAIVMDLALEAEEIAEELALQGGQHRGDLTRFG